MLRNAKAGYCEVGGGYISMLPFYLIPHGTPGLTGFTLQLAGAEELRTPDPLLAKPITRLLVVKPLLPNCEHAIKAYKGVVGVHLSESGVDYVAPITDVLGQPL